MSVSNSGYSREVKIVNDLGLHARASAMIHEITREAVADVWIIKDGRKVDAKSIIDILTLACAKDSNITIEIESGSDLEILDRIVTIIEEGFGE